MMQEMGSYYGAHNGEHEPNASVTQGRIELTQCLLCRVLCAYLTTTSCLTVI